MRILVTGGAGFIGSHIVDQYIAAGHEVAIVDNLWEEGGGKEANINPQARFFHTDITDETAMERVFNEIRPEVVNHQAAQPSVAISTRDPRLDARVNVLGLLNVLTNCTRVGTRKFIFASSGASYGTSDLQPVDEETPQRPESPYGITKMVAEHYLRYWHEANGLNYTALRYGNVYGPRQDPNGEAGVIAIFARHMLAHEPVRIDWDGEQQKDYVYVGDVAHASLLATLATGCTILTYTSPSGEHFTRGSLGANTSISSLAIEASTNGVRRVELRGYWYLGEGGSMRVDVSNDNLFRHRARSQNHNHPPPFHTTSLSKN